MPQQTNLNVAPYFDDFDANNDYYKVLFKPGYPVQARELTTLQSILQNQIEKFGQHFFKEGAKVIPGNTTYNTLYYAVEINNIFLGVPVEAYISQLVGTKITGERSGVTATVDKVLLSKDSERNSLTLYVNYLSSNTLNNSSPFFLDGENLITNVTIASGLLGNTSIAAGSAFANTIASNSTSTGSSFSISEGVYFIRGQFVNVDSETLILDQYSNTPNYRVGLFVNEEIITSDIDENLNDNSQGFNNYSSPGADRLRISVSLFKKNLNDFNDNNFIELATINNGIIRTQPISQEYNLIADELARRTYAESGDYYITPFDIIIKESLNDGIGNKGIFNEGQFTYGGSVASDNLGVYQISPGKAFVRGYEVETVSTTFLDFEKPRTTKTLENIGLTYNTGSTLSLNRVYGSPTTGIGNTYVLSLRSERIGTYSTISQGKEIGVARVYDFKLESGSYNASNSNLNEWNISLYDVQTVTDITLNQSISLTAPVFIKGKNSGATAFLKDSVTAGVALTVYQKRGEFIANESLIFDGIDNGRIAIAVTSYGISDIKSVYGIVGSAKTFNADVIQSDYYNVGFATITGFSGVSTIISTNPVFPGNIKINNLLKFSTSQYSDPIFARVVGVNTTEVKVIGVTTVSGICQGSLPTSLTTLNDLKVISTKLSQSTDNTLYTALPKPYVSTIDLTEATLTIRKTFTVNISGNSLSSSLSASENETFLPFDEERYTLVRSDGSYEVLTSDKFSITNGSKSLQIYNLGANDIGATLTATLTKIKPKSKIKLKNRVNTLIVDKSKYESSGIGSTTLNDGLSYGKYPYGTRVQDETISLNSPDIIDVHAIYESKDTNNPSAPTAVLSSISGSSSSTQDLIIGEHFVGRLSGAIGIVAERLTGTQISYIPENDISFKEGEPLLFKESNIQAVIITLDSISVNVSSHYSFDNGQKGSHYDYGFLTRNSSFSESSRRLKIYYSSGYYSSTDDGDITTIQSYNTFNYANEIQSVDSIRCSDIIDIRPRVSNYTTQLNSRSPLEFYGRSFNSSGNSSTNILASEEDIICTFSFYLGRIDRIYLSKDGIFQVKYGVPSETPEKPVSVDDSLEIATAYLPPYLFNTSQISIEFLEHKRYRMVDIKQLEDRIKNLEYYTSLSLLETNTSNLFVPDSDGLDRFKSGFFVDNFTSLQSQEDGLPYKNSIDLTNKELRPQHYTTSIDLVPFSRNNDNTIERSFESPDGFNIRKTGDIITLNYSEVEWLKQNFATRTENVTPFVISFWQATLELTPSSDSWIDTVRLDPKIINVEGNYTQTLAYAVSNLGINPQTGYAPTIWNSWETTWTGKEIIKTSNTATSSTSQLNWAPKYYAWQWWGWRWNNGAYYSSTTTTVTQNNYNEVKETGVRTRTGTTTFVSEKFDNQSSGDKIISREFTQYMRSRNIQFVSKNLKPLTQIYAFFDGINVTKYCIPKLLEIQMISGVFEVGETVIGSSANATNSIGLPGNVIPSIKFRVAQQNHKEGPYNIPSKIYSLDPYNNQDVPSIYSSTSKLLNIDTTSLSDYTQGQYGGWVESGMILVGKNSGARASIVNVRLISDTYTSLIGSFYIPDPNIPTNPRFETGNKTLTLINNQQKDKNSSTTIAEKIFVSSGIVETVQENIISTRNASIQSRKEIQQESVSKTSGTQLVSSEIVSQTTTYNNPWNSCVWWDPLAQSFLVDAQKGIFITRCDIFFNTKDDSDVPVILQIRTMQNGYPTRKVVPFSEVVLDPSQISTSNDGSVATSFVFPSPIYLEGGTEYAVVIGSNSSKYNVFISRVGENDLITKSLISNQPYLGSLFKSQNSSTWEASQWEDLKFTLYRADFVLDGILNLYSPELSYNNKQIANLMPNSLDLKSRRIRIGLSTNLNDSDLTLGNLVSQQNSNGTGRYVGNAGIATGTLSVTNSGIGYTPSSGFYTFNNVSLVSYTGSGNGATANISINNGVAVAATIVGGGNGYQSGDVLGISSIGSISVGANARFSIVSIGNATQLVLDNVQGSFESGVGKTITYANNSGITTVLNSSIGGNVTIPSGSIIVENDGLHVKVNHKNHGMYDSQNYVIISGVESDVIPTRLSQEFNSSLSPTSILVDNSSNFATFENVGISTNNPGYVLVGDLLYSYNSISAGSLNDVAFIAYIEPQSNNRYPLPNSYPQGTYVYKYELSGVSLNRINTTHDLSSVEISNPITFDSYHIKLNMSDSFGVGRTDGLSLPKLYIGDSKSTGGYNVSCTQNIPFEIIKPLIQNITVQGTSLTSDLKTISGKSINGNEIPFLDDGFASVSIDKTNYLGSTKLICSKINEVEKLDDKPSLNMRLFLNTTDSFVSPVIDTHRMNAVLVSNRINSPIEDYANDSRVNSIFEDPSAFQYISKEINLANPASSIKIILDAHINKYCDIRAFYSISQSQNFDPIFIPFPGYKNLNPNGNIINFENNDGRSDTFIANTDFLGFDSSSIEFKEYTFTADELQSFMSFRIKLVMSSTNQTYPPRIKNLRVISLA
jgi:hypothetical protein